MSTLLNISTDHAVRNLYRHDRWGLANESGDVLVVFWMQCSGNGRKGFLYVFVFGKMLKAAKDVWQSRVEVHNSPYQQYAIDSQAVPMMRTCWIFALSLQCGIFTTMIVEGLQIVLEISCSSAIWISDEHNGSVSLQHKKTWDPSKAIFRAMNCMTKSHSFHPHVCLLAFFVFVFFGSA